MGKLSGFCVRDFGSHRRLFFLTCLFWVVTIAITVGVLAPGTVYGSETKTDKLKVGFITVGPVSDWGFNYSQNEGRLGMEARLHDKVETTMVENIPETADFLRVIDRMVGAGTKVIFATSYGYADLCQRAAKKYPDVVFLECLGPTTPGPNISTYGANVWEAFYVAGVAAALTAKGESRFGMVTSHPIPAIFWSANAFTLGAQSVNPSATLDMVFTNSWYDPAAETEAAKSLIAQGAKLLYVHTDSGIAGVQTAEQAGVYSISVHADLSSFAPKKYVTGAIWKWWKLYVDIVQQVLDGTWKSEFLTGGFKEGYVDMASFGPAVDDAARQKVRETIAKIAAGELDMFAGPIYDSKGELKVPKGKALTINEVLGFDWAVKGVRGRPD